MPFPDFFAAAPTIRVIDPLAAFLGAAESGIIDYRYEVIFPTNGGQSDQAIVESSKANGAT